MRRTHGWIAGVLIAGIVASAPLDAAPQRVVSTFLCTDEYVFRLLPRDRIAALSDLAGNHPPVPPVVSTIAGAVDAARIPLIAPSAETIAMKKPDLVVMYRGTDPRVEAELRRVGIPVLAVPWANSLKDIRDVTRMLGDKLGAPDRAAALLKTMEATLAEARALAPKPPVETLIYEPNGYATTGGVADEIMQAAGLRNAAADMHPTRLGRVPVEAVIADPPELLILNTARERATAQADLVLQNPALRALKGKSSIVRADLKPLYCPGPWSAEAALTLAELGRLARGRHAP